MDAVSALDLRVEETLGFLERHLPERSRRVLDVGCGEGRLVARLRDRGVDALGIDASPEAVATARAAGRNVVQGDFLARGEGVFDAVVFGSSLHHLHPLEEAVRRAAALLAPGGLLLADEFDVAAPDLETARWFFDTAQALEAAGLNSGIWCARLWFYHRQSHKYEPDNHRLPWWFHCGPEDGWRFSSAS
jgi:SAM-dependent methyltransferase